MTTRFRDRVDAGRRLAPLGDRPGVAIAGRAVIVVDDGLATGSTARAALGVVRARGAEYVVLAVPVAPRTTVRELAAVADAVVAVATPSRMWAIGAFYDDFTQTTDKEVVRLLSRR